MIRYYKSPTYLAERLGIQGIRRACAEGFVILTEADMRMVDVTIGEKVHLFGCEELTEDQASVLLSNYEKKGGDK